MSCPIRRRHALTVAGVIGATLAGCAAAPADAADVWSSPIAAAPVLGACGSANAFTIPGTAGCLQIGGTVAAELSLPSIGRGPKPGFALAPPSSPALPLGTSRVEGRLSADVRLPTEAGPVRAFVSLRAGRRLMTRD